MQKNKGTVRHVTRNPTRTIPVILFDDDDDKISFHRFLRSMSTTSDWLGAKDFWQELVLQAAYKEPAVKHITLALGLLHRKNLFLGDFGIDSHRNTVFAQYTKALRATRELIVNSDKTDIHVALIACILFCIFDIQMHNDGMAHVHLQTGLKLAKQNNRLLTASDEPGISNGEDSRSLPSSDPMILISDAMNRIDLQSRMISFTNVNAPYPYHLTAEEDEPTVLPAIQYTTIDEARRALVSLMRTIWRVSRDITFASLGPMPNQQALTAQYEKKAECERSLLRWDISFQNLKRKMRLLDTYEKASNTCRLLSINHALSRLLVGCSGATTEMVWDAFLADFESIVKLTEELYASESPAAASALFPGAQHPGVPGLSGAESFNTVQDPPKAKDGSYSISTELWTLVPLALTGAKCRDPSIRRRAIRLLDMGNRVEGPMPSKGPAKMNELLMNVEENLARLAIQEHNETASAMLEEAMRRTVNENDEVWEKQLNGEAVGLGIGAPAGANVGRKRSTITSAADIPESARVEMMRQLNASHRGEFEVKCFKGLRDPSGPIVVHSGIVHL